LLHLQENFDCVTYFDELSEEAVKILSEHSELHNYRNCKDIKVNLIVLRHVLEHIHDLKSFINYLDDSLTPGGYLFIEVPDWGTFDDNTDTFIFEHLSQFNSTSLIDMMRKNGYHCHALEKSIHPDDPATPNRVMRFIFKKSVAPNFGSVEFAKFFQSFKEERYEYANKKLNRIYKEIGEKKTIAFYPASNLSFSAVLETEIEKFNLIGYFDSDKKKHGKSFLGYQVFPAESLVKKEPDYIFIFTQAYEPEIRDSFKKMNIKSTIYSITDILASDYE
jgi:SAM-dependent methyltransferase